MKKKNLFQKSTSPLLAILFVVMSAFMFTACDEDTEEPAPENNIVETLSDLGGYDSLIKYVSVYPDLVSTLNSASEKTLFAPNNAAFGGLLETPGFPQDLRDINPDIIAAVLAYHVVPGQEVLEADLSGDFVTAYNNEVIKVNGGTLETGATNSAITLGDTDIRTTTGVIHETNSVLIPPSIGARLTPILGTVSGTLLLGANFSDLATAIQRVDTARALRGEDAFAAILANRQGSYTVFAPVNQVFEVAGIDPSTADVTFLEAVIANHVVAGQNLSSADVQGLIGQTGVGTLATLGGNVNITPTTFQDTPTLAIGGAPVVSPDNVTGNGTVHAIAGFVSSVNTYTTVLLGGQNNTEKGFYNAFSNVKYSYAEARDASGVQSSPVDLAYYFGASNEATLSAIDSDGLNAVYSEAGLPIAGIFGTRNSTRFRVTDLAPAQFAGVLSNSQLEAAASSENNTNVAAANLQAGSVVAFTLDADRGGYVGLIRVVEIVAEGGGTITIEVKVQIDGN